MASDLEWAWVAGVYEGEGSVCRNGKNWRLEMTMTDRDTVERFAEIVGAGSVYERKLHPSQKRVPYRWTCGRRLDVLRIMKRIHPWLGIRRSARFDEVLADLERLKGGGGDRHPPSFWDAHWVRGS